MKRIILNFNKPRLLAFAVVVLAISLSAFTTHVEKEKNAKFGTYFWFRTDPAGNPQTTDHLVYQSSDPYGCLFLGLGDYCCAAYTDYTHDQFGYHAAGYQVALHYYLL